MRIVIFITIWACFGLMQAANAQESAKRKDTLIIQISGNSQLHIIGNSMKEISKYERADSLKNLFVRDYKKALDKGTIANSTHRIHYLVSKEGQRRMKAANDTYTEEPFDLEAEKKRFEFKLPAIHYTIYDLAKDIEMNFYLEDSLAINQLENFHISNALKMLSESKREIKSNYRLNFERDGLGFKLNEKAGRRQIELNMVPVVGLVVIGDRLSPMLGGDWGLVLRNKYHVPKTRFGFLFNGAMLYDRQEPKLTKFTEVINYEVSLSFNTSQSEKERWGGPHVGFITGLEDYGFPKNTVKFGFHFPIANNFTYSLDFISDSRKHFSNLFQIDTKEKSIYSMSVRAWF